MYHKPITICLFVLSYILWTWGPVKADDQQERILAVFHPYRQGFPQAEGIRPGMIINP
jgi:hypothetical protein